MLPETVNWPQLAVQTLRDPKSAAAEIMSWQVPRVVLWMAAALVAILGTLLSTLSGAMIPEAQAAVVISPFARFMTIAGAFVITVHGLFWIGRAFGGAEEMDGLLALLVWLQALSIAAHIAIMVSAFLAPALAAFMVLFVVVATLWILTNFISVGLQLNSLLRAFLVLLVISVGFSIILSMFGVNAVGVPSNV